MIVDFTQHIIVKPNLFLPCYVIIKHKIKTSKLQYLTIKFKFILTAECQKN